MGIVDTISIFSISFLIWQLILFYIFIRNEWVSKILDDAYKQGGIKEYNKFPAYETMLLKKFWVWDKEKLKDK